MAGELITSFDGTKLYLNRETSEGDRAVLVVVHGLCEHQGRYDYFAERLHEAGIGTYRFDHRGHGRSEGDVPHLDAYTELLDDTNVVVGLACRENPGVPVFVYGHSMGGFTVALWGVRYPDEPVAGIICNGGCTFDTLGTMKGVPRGEDPHARIANELGDGVCSVKEVRDWYLEDPLNAMEYTYGLCYAMQDGLAWFAEHASEFAYPVLVTHGELDSLVGQQDSRILFDTVASADKQLKIYGNLYHETINEYCRDEVIDDCVAWMAHRIDG